jgi:uncharacterized protein DUF262/uncharacterized protein DUF1524
MSENAFNSRSKTMGELLSSNQSTRIVVPTFQRGYSWEKKHVTSFWKDINGPEKKYFLGPIVTLSKPETDDAIELLDGQQRLATATILFSVFRDVARDLNFKQAGDFAAYIQRDFIFREDDCRCLQMGDVDDLYFKETIQSEDGNPMKARLRSHRHIHEARLLLMAAVRGRIQGQNPPEALVTLKGLRNRLRDALILACISVDSDSDAFQIFETLNDRGLRLSVPDLFLNYLMRVAPEEDRKHIRQVWNQMLTAMGKRDIGRFLRHLWVSKYGDLKSEGLFLALKGHITDKSVKSVDFVVTCADECDTYVKLLSGRDEELGSAAPYVRGLLQELDCQPALPLLLSASLLEVKAGDFDKVIKWLLVFVTRYSVLMGLDSSGLETVLFSLARDIRGKIDEGITPSVCLAHIKETLKKNAPSDEQIRPSARGLTLSPDDAKYVLRKLADHMESLTKESKTHEANLEHIYPENPDDSEWGGPDNHAKLLPYLWNIGNLTILGKRLNQGVENKEYKVKVQHYASKSELKMVKKIVKDYPGPQWGEKQIEARARTLTEDALTVWNFDNPSRV